MISTSYHTILFALLPISLKMGVFYPSALRRFDESKINLYITYFHVVDPRPVYTALVATHIYAMYFVAAGYADTKMLIFFIVKWIFYDVGDVVAEIGVQQQCKYYQHQYFP